MIQSICVYSSASDAIDQKFFQAAIELGTEIARRGNTLIFGGTNVGLMGAVAEAAKEQGGKVIGVIPSWISDRGLGFQKADELIVTADLRSRKTLMESRADAFVALPGGFGTLEEMLEIMTLKQLQQHEKPLVFLDIDGFYAPLESLFEHIFQHRFAKPASRALYYFTNSVADAFVYLDSYQPARVESKWFSPEAK